MTRKEALKLIQTHPGQYYVYALCHPNMLPFYIGSSGTYERLCEHGKNARNNRTDNGKNFKNNKTIQEIWSSGKEIEYEILLFTNDKDRAEDYEAELTNEWYPFLNNILFGRILSDETRQKMSVSRKGKKGYWYGRHHSIETLQKMSEAKKGEKHPFYGKHHSAESRERMRKPKKNRRGSL